MSQKITIRLSMNKAQKKLKIYIEQQSYQIELTL